MTVHSSNQQTAVTPSDSNNSTAASCRLNSSDELCSELGLVQGDGSLSLDDTCIDLNKSFAQFLDIIEKFNCRTNYSYNYSHSSNCDNCVVSNKDSSIPYESSAFTRFTFYLWIFVTL